MTDPWLVATVALLVPFAAAVVACARGSADMRLAALQFAASLTVLILVAMSFVFDQASSIDLALAFALVSLAGTLTFALFQERWL